jgi:hypothetical protein
VDKGIAAVIYSIAIQATRVFQDEKIDALAQKIIAENFQVAANAGKLS